MDLVKQSHPILDLLKQIHKTFSKRAELVQQFPEVMVPSFRTPQPQQSKPGFDPAVIQAADALMEVAFAVKTVVEPVPQAVVETTAGSSAEVRVKQLETLLSKLYAEKRLQDVIQAQHQDRFKKVLEKELVKELDRIKEADEENHRLRERVALLEAENEALKTQLNEQARSILNISFSSDGEVYTREAHDLTASMKREEYTLVEGLPHQEDSLTEPLLTPNQPESEQTTPILAPAPAPAPVPESTPALTYSETPSFARQPSETVEYETLKSGEENAMSPGSSKSDLSATFSNAAPFSQLIQEHFENNIVPMKQQMEGLEKSMLLSSSATGKTLQVVEKIEVDTEKIRENTAQTNAQLDKFEQQLVGQMKQLRGAWEADQRVVVEKQQATDASLLLTKKTLEENAHGLNLVNQTLGLLASTISEEFKKLASKLQDEEREKEREEQERKERERERQKEQEFVKTVAGETEAAQRTAKLLENLEAALSENFKLQAKKKYQLNEISKSMEELEVLLATPPVERATGMSRFAHISKRFELVIQKAKELKEMAESTTAALQQKGKELQQRENDLEQKESDLQQKENDLRQSTVQSSDLKDTRAQLLVLCQNSYSLILYLFASFISQAKMVQDVPALPTIPIPLALTQHLTHPKTSSALTVQEDLTALIQLTETQSPELMVFLEDRIDDLLAKLKSK